MQARPHRTIRCHRPRNLSPQTILPHAVMAACLAMGAFGTAPARAQAPAANATAAGMRHDIPAGTLDQVLNRFAARAGILLAIDGTLTAGKTSRGLSGNYSVRDGLAAILNGSGLEAVAQPAGGFVLRSAAVPAPARAAEATPARAAAAPEPRPDEELAQLPVVVVHGSLTGDSLEERMSLSSAKIIISRSEIEAFGDASMGEVIRKMPSISFGGPPGENNDARIRGLSKEYTQILIDGQPAPGRDFSIDQIPAHLVERIEIIRSTTANIDNQGIAGTVNIILRKTPSERVARWHASAGTMPEAPGEGKSGSLGVTFGDTAGNLRYQLDGILQNRFGVRTKDRQDYANGGTALTNREQDFEVREHTELGLSARLAWRLNSQDEFRLDPRYLYSSEDKNRDRLKKADLSEAERMDQVKTREYLGVNGQWQRKASKDSRYTLGFNLQGTDTTIDKIDRKGTASQPFTALPGFVGGNEDLIQERGVTLRASSQQRVRRIHALDMGVELGQMDWDQRKDAWKLVSASDLKTTEFAVAETKIAAYLQDEILVGEKHVLTPGLRLEHVNTRTRSSGLPTRNSDHLQPSPSVHWLTNIDDRTNWRASVTRSIRRPKYEDLSALSETKAGTLANPDAVGNPELKPETAWGMETGLERYFANKAGVASVNLFYRKMDDLIEKRIVQDPVTARYQQMPANVGEARTWGIELDGSRRFDLSAAHGITLRGNFSLMDSEVNDPSTGGKRQINDLPRHILNLGIDYEYKPLKLKFGAHYNQVGELQKVDLAGTSIRTQHQDPSHYLDLSASYVIRKDLLVRFSALNVLEAEKNRPRTTVAPNGNVTLFEQEDERSARSFQIRLEGRF